MTQANETGRILFIDDSELILTSVATRLRAEGFEVVTTTQTVGMARHLRSCDLVILDFHMPGIDGAEVLSSLKAAAAESGARCRFYLYTSDRDVAKKYASLGFDGALMNKGDLDALVQQVRTVFRMIRIRGLPERRGAT